MPKPKSSAQLDREIADALRPKQRVQTSDPAILMSEGKGWRQFFVVTDQRVAIVHMTPALWGGWNFQKVSVQGSDDWIKMTRDQIVDWKMKSGGYKSADDLDPGFRKKLLTAASHGAAFKSDRDEA